MNFCSWLQFIKRQYQSYLLNTYYTAKLGIEFEDALKVSVSKKETFSCILIINFIIRIMSE